MFVNFINKYLPKILGELSEKSPSSILPDLIERPFCQTLRCALAIQTEAHKDQIAASLYGTKLINLSSYMDEYSKKKDLTTLAKLETNKTLEIPSINSTENLELQKVLNEVHAEAGVIELENKEIEKVLLEKKVKKKKKSKKSKLKIFDRWEGVSEFSKWLLNFSPLKNSNIQKKKSKKKSKVQKLIDESIAPKDSTISEPLAIILANQGRIEQSIKMYEQLILKYPNKSSYFALQIEKLKK